VDSAILGPFTSCPDGQMNSKTRSSNRDHLPNNYPVSQIETRK